MSLKKDIIGADVQIGTNQAQAELAKLSKETARYNNENERLRLIMKKLELQGKKNSDEWKAAKKNLDANTIAIKQNQIKTEEYTQKLGITSLTIKQLRSRMGELRKQLASTVPNTPEWDKYNRELGETQTRYNQLNNGAQQTSGFLGKLKGAAGGLLPAFGFAAIIGGIISAGKEMFNLTKQIQGETIRSVTVFGDQLGYVERQAEKVAAKMGVTNREFVSMAANTADLLIPLDFTRKTAAEMSTQVQGLAGALDEWTAGKYGVAEVSNILTKAMLGEMEQLKGLGIAIRQDSKEYTDLVKQKEAIAGTTNAQARAMATLDLIYKKSADAQTAYTLEGNKLLRTQKSISLWFKNIKESISNEFSQAMESSTEKLREQKRVVDGLEQNLIPLIDRYDELSGSKLPLTSTEQEELNGLMSQVAEIAPFAITSIDKYGKVLGISTEKAREFVLAQQGILAIKNSDEISAQTKNLEILQREQDKLNTILANGFEILSAGGEVYSSELGPERIGEINKRLQDLGISVKGTTDYIKVLKGEPIINPDPNENGATAAKSLVEIQEGLLKQAKEMPETTEAEIIAKNQKIETIDKEIKRLNELGTITEKQRAADEIKRKQDEAEAERKRKQDEAEAQKKSAVTVGKVEYNSVVDDQKQQFDILKDMERDFMDFKQELDKKGEELSAKNIARIIAEKQARQELTDIQINAFGQLASAMAGAFEQGSAMQIAMIAIEKGIAIAQIWINLAREKSAINLAAANIAAMPIPGARFAAAAYAATMTSKAVITAGINTGLITAQTIASSASMKKRNKKEAYYDGGFTGSGADTDVSGFVHANEFVANATSVRNPTIKKALDVIDLAQRSGTVQTLNLPAVLGAGRQMGGYTDSRDAINRPPTNQTGLNLIGTDPAILSKLDEMVSRIERLKIYTAIEDFKKGEKNYTTIQNTRGL